MQDAKGERGNEVTATKLPSNGKIIAASASDAKCAIKMQNGCKSSECTGTHCTPCTPFIPHSKADVMKHSKILQKILQKNTVKKLNAIQMRIAMDDIRLTKLRVAESMFKNELRSLSLQFWEMQWRYPV